MKKMNRILALLLALAMALSLAACGGNGSAETTAAPTTEATAETAAPTETQAEGTLTYIGPMELDYAENFSIDLYEDGYRMISAGTGGYTYLVVPEGKEVPEALDEDVIVLQQPLTLYVSSTGMMSLVDAIGGLDAVKLVATDVDGWYLDNVISAMESGDIQYSGSYKEPDYELMVSSGITLHIDTTMVDGYPEVLEKFQELGIPSLVENSSKESHPLGRVEWVKLFGVLLGLEDEANAYFEEQKALVEAAGGEATGVTVAMGYITSSGGCYARNGGDYMAQMISLAGGSYILADMNPEESGNTSMTFEDWYASNKDADYLFYINFAYKFASIEEMIAYNPLFADFKAVQEGNVWITSADFTQSTAAIASIISDMNTILTSGDGDVTTDHLIKLG